MAHDTSELKTYPLRRLDRFPGPLLVAAAVLVVLGLAGFAAGLMADADRAWRAYLYNWIYFAGIAQGAVLLAAVVALTRGVWSRSLRRVALSFVAFLPIAYLVLFPPILLWGADHILPWLHEDVGGKAAYLNMPFLVIRHVLSLAVLLVLSLVFAYWQLRPDAGLARDAGWRGMDRLTRGWQGQEPEELRAHRKLVRLVPALALAYVLAYSFVAFDFVMSLDPHWMSTIIGPYVFMAAFLGGIAATALATFAYRSRLGLAEYVEGANIHDLGKLFFAFSVFWTYLFWSQYIVYWYGNIPHEQVFLVNRMQGAHGVMTLAVFVGMFVIPFFGLLGVRPKKAPWVFGGVAALSLLALWIERYLLIYATLYPGRETPLFGAPEVSVALGMLGLLLASLAWFGARYPVLQVWQPATEIELLGVEVEETPAAR